MFRTGWKTLLAGSVSFLRSFYVVCRSTILTIPLSVLSYQLSSFHNATTDQSHSPSSLVPVPKTLVIESRFKDVWDHETTYEVQNLAWKLGVDWQMSKAEKSSVGFDRSTLY